jgi:phage terminase large subunit-like protein
MPTATGAELPPDWRDWPADAKRRLLDRLKQRARGNWRDRARPEQLPPDDAWNILLLTGGRGSGKSWAGAHILVELIENDPVREIEGSGVWAIVAPTFADARDKCVESDESGILMALGTSVGEVKAGRSATVERWNRSIGEVVLHDGTVIRIDGADDGAYRIQGENLRGAWCDEIGLWKRWKTSWDESLGFALRKGQARRVATGTPKRNMPARKLVKRLLADAKVVSRRLRTADNLHNLAQAFIDTQVKPFEGTELGRQELEGHLLEDAEGALWKRTWFERDGFRASEPPHGGWQLGPVVGVDPADGNEDGAEHAYTVAALGMDHRPYVIENEGMRVSPYSFACEVVQVAKRQHGRIVLEKNHGGQWLVTVFERAMMDLGVFVPLSIVNAAQGKRTRAEPVAGLYERDRVRHWGDFPELEDQMTNWTGSPGETSPDRLDSLVWALTEFVDLTFKASPPESESGAVPYEDRREPVAVGAPRRDPIEGGAVGWT